MQIVILLLNHLPSAIRGEHAPSGEVRRLGFFSTGLTRGLASISSPLPPPPHIPLERAATDGHWEKEPHRTPQEYAYPHSCCQQPEKEQQRRAVFWIKFIKRPSLDRSTYYKSKPSWFYVFSMDTCKPEVQSPRASYVAADQIRFWSQMRSQVERLNDSSADWLEDLSSEWMTTKLLAEWKGVVQQYDLRRPSVPQCTFAVITPKGPPKPLRQDHLAPFIFPPPVVLVAKASIAGHTFGGSIGPILLPKLDDKSWSVFHQHA
ncbi:hypothetical protein DFH09DRAFT_1067703 [Mycena vulgaris]|nr:hypothetical protein DFH09DRAFT_1067703 [Mycena vulgaris]